MIHFKRGDSYLCNKKIIAFEEKMTEDKSRVSCPDCLDKLKIKKKKKYSFKHKSSTKDYVYLGGMRLSRKKWNIMMRGRK